MLSKIFVAALALASSVNAVNIVLTNDDGQSANTRALYYKLKDAGNNVLMCASAVDESGQSSRVLFPGGPLTVPGEFGFIGAGAPAMGYDPTDTSIVYVNSTPSLITSYCLRYMAPIAFKNQSTDLVVAGPNFGLNTGPQTASVSGTVGACIAAAHLGIPAIALSAFEGTQTNWTDAVKNNASAPANILAGLSLKLINSVIHASQKPLLPYNTYLTVNFPPVTCNPTKFEPTRITGSATGFGLGLNVTGAEAVYNLPANGANTCISGNCTLMPETLAVNTTNCLISVSVATADWDAPSKAQTAAFYSAFFEL